MTSQQLHPRTYVADEVLRDGGAIRIRAIRPDDKDLLSRHFSGLSDDSRYTRFFGAKRTLTRDELARFTELDFDSQVGLAATLNEDGKERFIGVGRYYRLSDRTRAEVAFAVLDEYQGRGIATMLLEHLRRIANAAGIVEFTAEVMASNRHMLDVFRDSGFQRRSSSRDGIVHVALRTDQKVPLQPCHATIAALPGGSSRVAAIARTHMKALIFNCGSSSLKFELIELDSSLRDHQTLASGKVEEIGPHATAKFIGPDDKESRSQAAASTHKDAALHALKLMESLEGKPLQSLDVVAHRVVHGGGEVEQPCLIDEAVYAALTRAAQFAPLHNPIAISVMRAVQEHLPGVPGAVVTDTAFHHDLPPAARTYGLPHDLAERYGIRRYGFHGIGHAWMMERYAEITGKNPRDLNLITFHLGAGCSACAIRNGKSVDTSMGLTPLEGLVMATRSGDLDPAIVTWLGTNAKIAPAEIDRILNHDSGMKGISGLSDDLRELEKAAESGNQHAELAIDVFCHRARKYLGAYLAIPGRPEAVIFSGGIGENSARVRARICADLEWLGLQLDEARNHAVAGKEAPISNEASRIAIHVVPMNEELYIARAALRLV